MFWLILILLIVLILFWQYKRLKTPEYIIRKLEKEINKIKPLVIRNLEREKKEWNEAFDSFTKDNKIVKTIYSNEREIIERMKDVVNELDMENKFDRLSEKYRHDSKKRIEITIDYYNYLVCLRQFQQAGLLLQVGGSKEYEAAVKDYGIRKQEIQKRFEVLVNERLGEKSGTG